MALIASVPSTSSVASSSRRTALETNVASGCASASNRSGFGREPAICAFGLVTPAVSTRASIELADGSVSASVATTSLTRTCPVSARR